MSPDWGLHSVSARVVVGTRAIRQGSARGLALMAEVRRWPGAEIWSSNSPFDLTLIPDQLEMRFPCSGQLMLTLLWKPSLGMIKRGHAGRLGQISPDSGGPFYIELRLDKGLEGPDRKFNPFRPQANQFEGEIKEVTLS